MSHSTECFPLVQYLTIGLAQEAAYRHEQKGIPTHSYPCHKCGGFHIETFLQTKAAHA